MAGILYGLWSLLHGHRLRLLGFAVAAVPKNIAGNSLLYVEVSHIDINKYAAHAMNMPVMALIGFVTSVIIWWSRDTPIKQARKNFTKVEIVMFGAGQACFVFFAGILGVPYLAASCFNMLVLGLVHYFLLDREVFTGKSETA